ncbi:hypothetical protein IKF03_00465 [Candidatus Saccharibacteria bacterium]|nr:hypothetical protein [Candidatus Saccharibacteria bacterium]
MEATEEMTQEVIKELVSALPETAEADFQAWLENPSEEGLNELLTKYNVDAKKIARAKVIKEKENE